MCQKEKIKVIWVCSFENREVADLLNAKFTKTISPWITDLIELFRDRTELDLSIITPNYYSNKNEQVNVGNIAIYLFQYRPFYLPKRAYNLLYYYSITKKNILKIVKKLTPDIIHLHGSENPLYGAGIAPLIDIYPVLVTIQGFVSLSESPKNWINRYIRWNRIRFEKIINKRAAYFSVGTKDGLDTVRTFNKEAKVFHDYYPTTKPLFTSDDCPNKVYDIVYYAKISKDKGIEDLLAAIVKLKTHIPNINAIVIGGGRNTYVEYITGLIDALGLSDNVTLAGFQPTQQDVFKLAIQARIYVLPTHFDALPGSLREAMFMKLPVVSNSVGGIPALNNEMECITLAEPNNVDDLVEKICLVFEDSVRTQRLVNNAYEIITSKFDNNKIYSNLLSIYDKILQTDTNK